MPRPARRALLLLTIARARVLELDAEELEPLRRTSQLPAAGASDLIEVFTLRARVAVPSLFEEAVRLEHYALAFRNQGVSWKQASEGNGVVAVHYLPANASALLGFPDRNGSFPDASADVYVDAKKFDPEYWRDADYVGTIGGAAFAGLARELPSYATLRPVYKAVDPGAVDGGAFVLWCLETLAAHGATLTPLARLERRVPTLYVKNEEEKGDARAFARDLSRCVSDQQPESYDLSSLAATYVDNSAPLPRCLRNKAVPLAGGSWVALEAPYYAYVESYPRAPAPGTGANTEKGFSVSDLALVIALIGVVLIGLGRIFVVKGCCVCEEARPMFASSTRRRASRSGDEYGGLMTAETELPVRRSVSPRPGEEDAKEAAVV